MRLEAQATCALSGHPNIVEIFDLGSTASGRPYLAMERLVGRTLKQEVKARGPLPAPEAIGIVIQVLAGLAAAHRTGLVHRDIKPDNLFLCEPGHDGARRVKILDFGIVKVLPGGRRAPAPLAIPTAEGVAIGTPRFLSPEQAMGRPVDARTDVYAAGAVLFWLVAGRDPFSHREGLAELVHAHVMEVPPLPSSVAEQAIPLELDHVILRALAKRPEQRFPGAAEMAAALEAFAEPARPARPARRWPRTEQLDTRAFQPSAARDHEEAETLPTLPLPRKPRSDSPVHPASTVLPPVRPHTWIALAAVVFVVFATLLLYTAR